MKIKKGKNGESSQVANQDELEIVSKLLGLPAPKLAKELTTRVFQSKNRSSFYEVPLNVESKKIIFNYFYFYFYFYYFFFNFCFIFLF